MLKNKTFGSALIIAGTTIGAGMLAMPLTSAGIGFGYTVFGIGNGDRGIVSCQSVVW